MEFRRGYQLFLAVFGVIVVFIATLHIVFGPAIIPGSYPVNATMDSEGRFFATLFLAFGVAILWSVRRVESKTLLVNFLAITFLAGGLARLVSMAAKGQPHPFFVVMTILELVIPFIMLFLQFKVSRKPPAINE